MKYMVESWIKTTGNGFKTPSITDIVYQRPFSTLKEAHDYAQLTLETKRYYVVDVKRIKNDIWENVKSYGE